MTRTGKIARLPRDIREALNRCLQRNIPGVDLVDWLNCIPEVQEILQNLFEGKPISPQNLSEWRHGGFAEWQAENDFLERLRDLAISSETIEANCGHMADHAARLLSARMALIIANPSSSDDALANLKHLTPLVRNLTLLRRADHSAARLKLAQQTFDRAREDHDHCPPAESPIPEVARTQSNQIKPLYFPPEPESKPRSETPPGSGDSRMQHNRTVEQFTNGTPATGTQSNLIKPQNSDPAEPESKRGPEAPAALSTDPAPVSGTDLWQMRHRALPSDPPPPWRIQLPTKTVLPLWLTPLSCKVTPPTRARTAR